MSKLSELKVQRANTKACITRIKTLIENSGNTLPNAELECRLGILEAYFKQLLEYQTAIEGLSKDKDSELQTRGDLEDLYCITRSNIMTLLAVHREESIAIPDNSIQVPTISHINLPKLKLPTFSGRYSDYPRFIGTFKQLVHLNNNLSVMEKFNHLLNCLSGSASHAINAFEVTKENYPKALQRLEDRFDNKCLILQEHITDLFNLSKVSKNNANQLRDLIDSTNCHFSALLSLGSYEQIANAMIIHLVHTKLDAESQTKWDEAIDYSKIPNWDDCSKVLSRRCQFLETKDTNNISSNNVTNNITSFGRNAGNGNKSKSNSNGHFTRSTSLAVIQGSCVFCQISGHTIYKCKKFTDMNVVDRFREVKKLGLCVNCLGKGHSIKACKSSKCRICSHPHHTMLHRFASTSAPIGQASFMQTEGSSFEPTQISTNLVSAAVQADKSEEGSKDHVFLATAVVRIQDNCGRFHLARALLDSASQVSLITENLAQRLRLPREKFHSNLSGVGEINTQVRHKACAVIKSRLYNFEMNLSMWVLPKITELQPENKVNISDWNIPKNLELADPQFNIPQKIDLLIGAGQFLDLLSVGQVKLGEGLPTLQKTLFGWIVSGRYKASCSYVNNYNAMLAMDTGRSDSTLDTIVQKFWHVEEVAPLQPSLSEDQLRCESIFMDKVKHLKNGRFMVKLPFKHHADKLGNSFNIALKRFINLERRLDRDAQLQFRMTSFLHFSVFVATDGR